MFVVLKERIKDRYSQEIPNEMIVDEDVDDLEFRIDRIEKSIENIGPINMAVKDEYDEELKRISNNISTLSNAKSQQIQVRDTSVVGGIRTTTDSYTHLTLPTKRKV